MQAFQIKAKTRRTAEKMIKTERRQRKFERNPKIAPRKEQTKEPLGKRGEHAALEGIDKTAQKIVKCAAEKSEQRAEQKCVKMAHFKRPESDFPPP